MLKQEPAFLKANGYDAIVFRGKADSPLYIYIDGDKIELKDAKNVWGKITGDAEEIIKKEIGNSKVEIAQIGPAGENLVKYACVINKLTRANGRNGIGTVMGSKNLKAVVVQRKKTISPYDKEGFNSFTKSPRMKDKVKGFTDGWGVGGTGFFLRSQNRSGFLPTKNYSEGYMEDALEIDGRKLYEKEILKGRETCYACAVRCKRVVEIPGKVFPKYGGPEYETLATFGSYCGVTDLETICLCNQLCNMYGLDTISTGATIAFAMECFEKEFLTKDTTDGLELTFGNQAVLPLLIEKIAKREGFGDFLAEGSKSCADKLGEEAIPLFMGVKGQEFPAHMPQIKPGLGVIYSINPYGADHQTCEHDNFLVSEEEPFKRRLDSIGSEGSYNYYSKATVLDENKMRYIFDSQCFYSINDTLGLCTFVWGITWQLFSPINLLDLCKYGIGWDTSIKELLEIGERRINMMRHFNAREGFTKDDDKLPERVFHPLPEGPGKGIGIDKEQFSKAQEMYYKRAGWDGKTGNPTEETLKRLKLDWLLS
jgi:aldehyde:ferredoxin oxidoreductase